MLEYSRAVRCLGLLLTLLQTQWSIVFALMWYLKPISQRWGVWNEVISAGEHFSQTPSRPGNGSWILFPHCKSSQTCWPAAAAIKVTMPVPSIWLLNLFAQQPLYTALSSFFFSLLEQLYVHLKGGERFLNRPVWKLVQQTLFRYMWETICSLIHTNALSIEGIMSCDFKWSAWTAGCLHLLWYYTQE